MPLLIRGPTRASAPSQYTLAPREAFTPEAVTATFDGTGAAGAFLPTLSIYSQDGVLIARCPATAVNAGDSAEVTFAPLLRAATAAAAASALPFGSCGLTGPFSVASGVPTDIGFDAGSIFTSDPSIFSIDAIGGNFGFGIHATGSYMAWWTVTATDSAGFPVPAPETFTVFAREASATEILTGAELGSFWGRGFTNLLGRSQWDVSWGETFVIHGSTGATPIQVNVRQSTGQPLDCSANVLCVQMNTGTFGN